MHTHIHARSISSLYSTFNLISLRRKGKGRERKGREGEGGGEGKGREERRREGRGGEGKEREGKGREMSPRPGDDSVVEHLPGMCDSLGSTSELISNIARRICSPDSEEIGRLVYKE